jgi:hypothetical protein
MMEENPSKLELLNYNNFMFFRWRGRNRLSYLHKTSSSFETNPEHSEHPLIYDDTNIHFLRSSCTASTHISDQRRPIVRDTSGLSQQV